MSKTPSRCTSYSRLFSIVDYFSTLPRMPTQADRASIDSIGSLLAWMLNPLINMILMHPGGGEQLPSSSQSFVAIPAAMTVRNAGLVNAKEIVACAWFSAFWLGIGCGQHHHPFLPHGASQSEPARPMLPVDLRHL